MIYGTSLVHWLKCPLVDKIIKTYFLFQAANWGYTDIVKMLLSSNKVKDTLDLQDVLGQTALFIGIIKIKKLEATVITLNVISTSSD